MYWKLLAYFILFYCFSGTYSCSEIRETTVIMKVISSWDCPFFSWVFSSFFWGGCFLSGFLLEQIIYCITWLVLFPFSYVNHAIFVGSEGLLLSLQAVLKDFCMWTFFSCKAKSSLLFHLFPHFCRSGWSTEDYRPDKASWPNCMYSYILQLFLVVCPHKKSCLKKHNMMRYPIILKHDLDLWFNCLFNCLLCSHKATSNRRSCSKENMEISDVFVEIFIWSVLS